MLTRCKKNSFMVKFKEAIQHAYKTGNIPRLNDLSQCLIDLIHENEQFRIHNRHLEPQPIYDDLDSYVNLYSMNLHLISKLEFGK